jgi:hypothetical protein
MVGGFLMGVYLTDVHLTDVHLISVYLMDVYLTGVHLMAVHLTGVHLIGMCLMAVSHGRASYRLHHGFQSEGGKGEGGSIVPASASWGTWAVSQILRVISTAIGLLVPLV